MTEPTSSGADADIAAVAGPPAATSPESASVWEDFIDIFYAPSKVFARRSMSGFLIPMLVVTIAVGILYAVNGAVWGPIADAETLRSLAGRADVPPEAIERARRMAPTIGKVGILIGTPIGIFIIGLVLWLVGKLFEAKQTLGQAVMVASYASIPRIVEGLATSVQALLLDPSQFTGRLRVSIGLGRFFDPETTSHALLGLLGSVDVFTIWVTVLLAIGLSVTGKIPRARAAGAGVIVWLVGAGLLAVSIR